MTPVLQWVCCEDFTRAFSWSTTVYEKKKKKDISFLLPLSLESTSLSHQNQNGLKMTVKFVIEFKRKHLSYA